MKMFYSNAKKDKLRIFKENNRKSGIYKWTNKINGKFYVGSAVNLTERLRGYFTPERLNKILLKSKSLISNSLLKYGYDNFSLDILEYCEPSLLLEREQYYLDLLNPKYNICKKAGSTLGRKMSREAREKISIALTGRKHSSETILKIKTYKHSPETILKMKGRKINVETLIKLRTRTPGIEAIARSKEILGHKVIITSVLDNSTKIYVSIREAAKSLKVSHTTVRDYIKTGKLLKNTFLIKKSIKDINSKGVIKCIT